MLKQCSVNQNNVFSTYERSWIGYSEGTIIKFPIVGENKTSNIFTTRPDTVYGVTFMIFAPEHPWVREFY